MKHISILIPEGDCSLTHIEATHQILSEVNVFLARMEKPPLFFIQLVGLNKETRIKKGMFGIYPDVLIGDINQTDIIIIPALQGDLQEGLSANATLIPWLVEQHKGGADIASLCLGSFLLASTGLLKGKKCTTHWSASSTFKAMFPDIDLVPDKIITDEGGLYSSGGALSSFNLILYLIEKYAGRDIAILIAKTFMIEIDRESQSPFMIFKGQKEHQDEPITKAQEFIEQNFDDKITIDQLASMFAISRRNLERRFKSATSNSILEYIQRVRIEAAKKRLESARLNVNEVMYEVGYCDSKAFRNTFKKITGLSPGQYRNKYQKVPTSV